MPKAATVAPSLTAALHTTPQASYRGHSHRARVHRRRQLPGFLAGNVDERALHGGGPGACTLAAGGGFQSHSRHNVYEAANAALFTSKAESG
jgi:hypothetical protein